MVPQPSAQRQDPVVQTSADEPATRPQMTPFTRENADIRVVDRGTLGPSSLECLRPRDDPAQPGIRRELTRPDEHGRVEIRSTQQEIFPWTPSHIWQVHRPFSAFYLPDSFSTT
jgi:hypothetical protein